MTIGLALSFTKAPTVDRERDQTQFSANRRVSRLHVHSSKQLFFAEIVHAAMPMDEQQPRRAFGPPLWQQQQCRYRLHAIKVEHQPLQQIRAVILSANQLGWNGLMLPRQIAQ